MLSLDCGNDYGCTPLITGLVYQRYSVNMLRNFYPRKGSEMIHAIIENDNWIDVTCHKKHPKKIESNILGKYWCYAFAVDYDFLYVGCTSHLGNRMYNHRYFRKMENVSIYVKSFSDKDEARNYEIFMIETYNPIGNSKNRSVYENRLKQRRRD